MITGFKVKMLSGAMVLAMGGMLGGCNDGGDDVTGLTTDGTTASSTTLTGTAAGGAAIIGSVTVKDVNGATKSALINDDGSYEIDVADMTGPFVLRASGKVGGKYVTYHSAATAADVGSTVNITQFTDLIIANVASQLATTFFENYASDTAGKLTGESLNAAEEGLQAKLQPVLTALGLDKNIDLLRASFSADHTGLDAVLDLISIVYTGDTATIIDTLHNKDLGTDDVTTKSDDSMALDSSLTAALAAVAKSASETTVLAAADLNTWINNFTVLFATTPSEAKLTDSGLIDTTDHFLDRGENYDQFVGEVTTDDGLAGLVVTQSSITFTNADQTRAIVSMLIKLNDGVIEDATWQFEKQSGVWKLVGDQRIVDQEFSAIAVNNVRLLDPTVGSSFSGLKLYLDATDYNARASSDQLVPVDYAMVTGPGLPAGGVELQANSQGWMAVAGSGGNQVPECVVGGDTACVTVADTVDHGEYSVKFYAAGGVELTQYAFTAPLSSLKPLPTSALAASTFPSLTSVKVNGVEIIETVNPAAFFSANTNVSVAWTLPAGIYSDHLNIWAGTNSVSDEVLPTDTSATFALDDTSAGQGPAGLWLETKDNGGRVFAVFGNPY